MSGDCTNSIGGLFASAA